MRDPPLEAGLVPLQLPFPAYRAGSCLDFEFSFPIFVSMETRVLLELFFDGENIR